MGVRAAATVPASSKDRKRLRRLGDAPVIAHFTGDDGVTVEFASDLERAADLVGPLSPRPSTSPTDAGASPRASASESGEPLNPNERNRGGEHAEGES